MSDVIDRPMLEKEATAKTRLRIIDCDVHPSVHQQSDLFPFMEKRWQEHLKPMAAICARPIWAPRRIRARRR